MHIPSESTVSPKPIEWRTLWSSLTIALLALAIAAPARSQDPPPTPEEIAKAAREAREHKANSTEHPKIVTNDNLVVQTVVESPLPVAAPAAPGSPSAKEAEAPKPKAAGCDNPNAERLQAELLSAQAERDQLRSDLSSQPAVISGGNVDLKNFKPGAAGLNVGAPALLETQSPNPARVQEVTLEEKIASLKKAVKIACDSPEDAGIQAKIDTAEQELNTLLRQLVLDQDAYYSKPNYAGDTAGKAQLDAELAQKQSLESDIERLKAELAASRPN